MANTVLTVVGYWLALNVFIVGLRSYFVWKNQPPPRPKRTCEVYRLYS